MTVCLTGDVHHMSMGTRDQDYLEGTEVEAALEYAQIAGSYDVSVTLFLTGRCGVEERSRCEQLGRMDGVEIGGHNYFAYRAPLFGRKPYNLCRKLFGIDAPAFVHRWEVDRTRQILGNLAGESVKSWRDHGYRHDKNTTTVLREEDITHFSDEVSPEPSGPYEGNGLRHVPINVIPDHEHLYHGYRTPEYVRELDWSNAFTGRSFEPEEWLDRVRERVGELTESGGTATILAHPACMQIVDDLKVFEQLCEMLSQYDTKQMHEL